MQRLIVNALTKITLDVIDETMKSRRRPTYQRHPAYLRQPVPQKAKPNPYEFTSRRMKRGVLTGTWRTLDLVLLALIALTAVILLVMITTWD